MSKIKDTLPESQIDMSDFLKEQDEAAAEAEKPADDNPTPASQLAG